MNEAIIEKALKNAEKPEFNVDVIWDNFPLKQIEMLKDIMEIPEDEIIDWYLDNIEMIEVVDALKTAIRSKILCNEGEELANQIKAIVPDITVVNTLPIAFMMITSLSTISIAFREVFVNSFFYYFLNFFYCSALVC